MAPRELYFFRSYEDQYTALIQGEWKMVKYHGGKYELFNVVEDISERNNLIDIELDIVKSLKTSLSQWEEKAVPNF